MLTGGRYLIVIYVVYKQGPQNGDLQVILSSGMTAYPLFVNTRGFQLILARGPHRKPIKSLWDSICKYQEDEFNLNFETEWAYLCPFFKKHFKVHF